MAKAHLRRMYTWPEGPGADLLDMPERAVTTSSWEIETQCLGGRGRGSSEKASGTTGGQLLKKWFQKASALVSLSKERLESVRIAGMKETYHLQ
jgi:hypothetical protein